MSKIQPHQNGNEQSESDFEQLRVSDGEGQEYWSARKFVKLLDYTKWQNAEQVIKRAMEISGYSGAVLDRNFHRVKVRAGKNKQLRVDYFLSRQACLFTLFASDITKPAVQQGLQYFVANPNQTVSEEVEENLEYKYFYQVGKEIHSFVPAPKPLMTPEELIAFRKKLNDLGSMGQIKRDEPPVYWFYVDQLMRITEPRYDTTHCPGVNPIPLVDAINAGRVFELLKIVEDICRISDDERRNELMAKNMTQFLACYPQYSTLYSSLQKI